METKDEQTWRATKLYALNNFAKIDKDVLKTVGKFVLPYNSIDEGVEWNIEKDGKEVGYFLFEVEGPEIDIDMTNLSPTIFLI